MKGMGGGNIRGLAVSMTSLVQITRNDNIIMCKQLSIIPERKASRLHDVPLFHRFIMRDIIRATGYLYMLHIQNTFAPLSVHNVMWDVKFCRFVLIQSQHVLCVTHCAWPKCNIQLCKYSTRACCCSFLPSLGWCVVMWCRVCETLAFPFPLGPQKCI